VCGDTVVWKPSLKTPLTAIATQKICAGVLEKHGFAGVLTLVIGSNDDVAERMLIDKRLPLISFTGSTPIGRRVSSIVNERLGRTLLELGGNNGVVAMNDANVDMVVRAVLFGAVGTAGQRCTSTRRLFVQKGIAQEVTDKLLEAYGKLRIGNPLEADTLVGPLIDETAVKVMLDGIDRIREAGATLIYGGVKIEGCYVKPAIVKAVPGLKILKEEIFAPILYVIEFEHLIDGILAHNNVPQGLSSSMFTSSVVNAETFLSHAGSDCGMANINLGTSGAEIGGAFVGEKETGGGRESGSDAWRAYMRRQTVTVNWSGELPLAQGVKFDL
jgi:aldehyde dehydrogenase (NAD+)